MTMLHDWLHGKISHDMHHAISKQVSLMLLRPGLRFVDILSLIGVIIAENVALFTTNNQQ